MKKMFHSFVFFCLCFLHLVVFADGAVKIISVTEGHSVTLESNVTQIQKHDLITWRFEHQDTPIALINKEAELFSTYDDVPDGRFRGRLKLDNQTGSLTITHSRTTDSGEYNVIIKRNRETTYRFNVTVYARLPVPVVSRNSPNCLSSSSSSSSSNCSLLCSVVNVCDVTLSWYKGNSLMNKTSVCDLSKSLSLPLEVEYQDKNTYSCVLNNPISSQTTHLDINTLCNHTCAGATSPDSPSLDFTQGHLMALISTAAVGFLLLISAVGIFYMYRKRRKTGQQETDQTRNEDVTYADPTFLKRKAHKSEVKVEEEVVYAGVVIKH